MKLQISFDMTNLVQALEIAYQVAPYADILEIGTPLLYSNGITAIEQFKNKFPTKEILADTKIVDRGKDIVLLCAQAGADWVTIMAGTNKNVIHAACNTAHEQNTKIMLDLLDSASIAQSALEAKNLGATAILFHQPVGNHDLMLMDKWELVTGNATVPIFASGAVNRKNIESFINVHPRGIIVGKAITDHEDPSAEAAYFHSLLTDQNE